MRRKWITVLRIFRYGLSNFSRNAWLSTAATVVMTITLLIILTTFTARMVFNDTISQVKQKIDVSVYLKDGADNDEVKRFAEELAQVDIVTSVEYISKEKARDIFSEQNKEELEQLEALGELGDNPFPASLRIKTSDPDRMDELNSVVNSDENKELQSEEPSNSGERKAAIDTIANVSKFIEMAGLVAGSVFVVISVMIIFNTIRMAIFNRRDEIQIMKLIGAEKRFIRGPFLVEAAMYGCFAAIFSLIVVYALLFTKAGDLSMYEVEIQNTLDFFARWPVLIVLSQIAIGVVIGIFSALLAIRRYLKL